MENKNVVMCERYDELGKLNIKGQEKIDTINNEFHTDFSTSKELSDKISHIRKTKYYEKSDLISQKLELKGIDGNSWKSAWLKDEETSINIKNPNFSEQVVSISDKFDDICAKYEYEKVEPFKSNVKASKKCLQVVISDSHVGLDPSNGGTPLFQYEYNGKIYKEKLQDVFNNIVKEKNTHGKFEELILLDLGDREDGLGGQTTRGGHNLPQNMTDIEVFETCVDAKIKLVDSILKEDIADKIIIRDIVNSNHTAVFAHLVSSATSKCIHLKYGSVVEVEILERFLEHRTYGDHTFIYTHGKDSTHQFKGLPLQLNDKSVNFINDYLDHYEVTNKYIHVLKGDLHQIGFNKVKKFDYRNFPSFAPGSSWVQHNFGDGYSGYSIQVIPRDSNEISHTDYFIDYKKK